MNSIMNKKLAIVDIDGTLVRGQSQQALIKYLHKSKIIGTLFYLRLQAWFVLYKIGLIKDNRKVFNFAISFLKGKSVKDFEETFKVFFQKEILNKIYPKSGDFIKSLKEQGYTILLLSTAIEPLVSLFAVFFQADDLICTKLTKNDGIYLGTIENSPVYGEKKVELLKKYCQENNFSILEAVAYGDHVTDIPVLKLVGKGYVANPDNKMKHLAEKTGLGIIYLS